MLLLQPWLNFIITVVCQSMVSQRSNVHNVHYITYGMLLQLLTSHFLLFNTFYKASNWCMCDLYLNCTNVCFYAYIIVKIFSYICASRAGSP
jgi:hypothetical protein